LWEPDKVRTVMDLVLKSEGVAGVIGELGVFRGGGTLLIAEMLKALSSQRVIFGIDSFEGLPEETEYDVMHTGSVHYQKGMFKSESNYQYTADVMALFQVSEYVRLVKGYFEDVLPAFVSTGGKYSLIIVDPDQYKGTLDALDAFYDRVTPGGYILFDDYYSAAAIGVAKAAEEYLAEKPEAVVRGGGTMAYFQKM
jgi:O-methyltransferase